MDENKVFTKGNPDEITKRLNQVNVISVHCPINDVGISHFWKYMIQRSSDYKRMEDDGLNQFIFDNVPVVDMFFNYMSAISECKLSKINIDCLYGFWTLVSSFKFLKYINLIFDDSSELLENYNLMRGNDVEKLREVMDNIYKIEMLEFNLHDMFDQNIIDMLNKSFMVHDIIKNSYLDREFMICFSYDDYTTYMDMLVNNNYESFNNIDTNIIEYLTTFPTIMKTHKPIIKVITDYPTI